MAQAVSVCLSALRSVNDSVPVRVRCVMDKLALEQVYLRVLELYLFVFIIIPMLQGHLLLLFALTRRTNGRSLGTFKMESSFENRGH